MISTNILTRLVSLLDYDIPLPTIDVAFTTARLGDELHHTYTNIDDRPWSVGLFAESGGACDINTAFGAADGLALATGSFADCAAGGGCTNTGTATDLNVNVNVEQGELATSGIGSFWSRVGNVATMKYCIRVDLYADMDGGGITYDRGADSVSFQETIVTVTLDMLQCADSLGADPTACATVTSIDIDHVDASATAAPRVNYDIQTVWVDPGADPTTVACNWGSTPYATARTQQDEIVLCINSNTQGVRISSVKELDMKQGALTLAAIEAGAANAVTSVDMTTSTVANKSARIITRLDARFFEGTTPANVDVSGVLVIDFFNEARKYRQLTTTIANLRGMQDKAERELQEQGNQEVAFAAEGLELIPSSSVSLVVSTLTATIGVVATMLLL